MSHHALVFESRSPQESTFRNPRAVVFGKDATFVIAFNGGTELPGFSSLDTMEFDRERASFVFREIVFPEDAVGPQPRFSEDNPASCAACHGDPPRPIWDIYPLWPGVYGERADDVASEPERRGLAEYETNRARNPRYALLVDRPLGAAEAKALAYHGARRATPNAELGASLARWNAEAVVHDVITSPRFLDYRYALLASFAGACSTVETISPIAERSSTETFQEFTAKAYRAYERQSELKNLRALAPGGPPARISPFALNRFRYVAEVGMGVTREGWSVAFERDAYDASEPGFAQLFVERASAEDPQLRHLVEVASNGDCRELQRRSLTEPEVRSASPIQRPSLAVHFVSPRSSDGAGDRNVADLLQTCVGCHRHGPGPPIPIDDVDALWSANRQTHYLHGSLLAEILFRLRPEAGARRMPMGIDLSKAEAESLEAHFRSVLRDEGTLAGESP